MRANAPVYWDDDTGIWGLASHEAVRVAAKDWQTFCSGKGSRPDSSVPSMINMDFPQHSFRRGIVKDGFTVRRVDAHEPYLRAKVGELLDAVADRGECDLVADIATPLPMYMIGTLMGLPEADHDRLLHWSDLFAAGDEELIPQIEQAVWRWNDYILAHAAPGPGPRQRRPDQPDVRRRARRAAAQRRRLDVRVDARARRR